MIHNYSVEEISQLPSILVSSAYREVTYKEDGEDPIEPPEIVSTKFGKGTD